MGLTVAYMAACSAAFSAAGLPDPESLVTQLALLEREDLYLREKLSKTTNPWKLHRGANRLRSILERHDALRLKLAPYSKVESTVSATFLASGQSMQE